jgi:cytochrome P450
MSCLFAGNSRTASSEANAVSFARYPNETLIFGSSKVHTHNGLAFYQACERIAGIVQTRFLWKRAYIITDPAAIQDVLVNSPRKFIKPYTLRRLKILFGDGLLTSDGEVWTRHRRLLQPAFSSERMPAFMDAVRENTEEMLASWRDGEVRNVYPELIDLCMKNVTQTMFGVYDEELGTIVRGLATTCHQLVKGVFDVIKPRPFTFRRELTQKAEKQLGDLGRYIQRLIDRRVSEPPREDFLGLLLTADPPLSWQAILDECVTMLLAGHETTASAMVWCIYLLGRHPYDAERLAHELEDELGGEAPSQEKLDSLDRLRATLDEVLRLYPPTHRIARTITEPVRIGGHSLRTGADVVIPQWAVHRSPRWYSEPESFVPTRWTSSFRKSLPRFAYFPFSGGVRTCVGTQLAWCESAVILAMLAQRFRLSLVESTPLVPCEGLTLLPGTTGLRVRIEKRRSSVGADLLYEKPMFVD